MIMDYDQNIIDECHQPFKRIRFVVCIANVSIEVLTCFPGLKFTCNEYISHNRASIHLEIQESDIEQEIQERKKMFDTSWEDIILLKESIEETILISRANKTYYASLALCRKIIDAVLPYSIFLMHGAVIALGNDSYMFTAPSGTGKTTHIKLWLDNLPDSFVVNGDKPLIKITPSEAIACGTPWCGKEQLGTNTMFHLNAIICMERAEDNSIEEITFPQAYPFLLSQTYIQNDSEKANKTLSLLSQLYGKVRFYKFKFNNFKDNSFDVAYEALLGRDKQP